MHKNKIDFQLQIDDHQERERRRSRENIFDRRNLPGKKQIILNNFKFLSYIELFNELYLIWKEQFIKVQKLITICYFIVLIQIGKQTFKSSQKWTETEQYYQYSSIRSINCCVL